MRLLLDTHVLLWAMVDPGHLTDAALDVVRDGRHEVFASAASVWENRDQTGGGTTEGAR